MRFCEIFRDADRHFETRLVIWRIFDILRKKNHLLGKNLTFWGKIWHFETQIDILEKYLLFWDKICHFETIVDIMRQHFRVWDILRQYSTLRDIIWHSVIILHNRDRKLDILRQYLILFDIFYLFICEMFESCNIVYRLNFSRQLTIPWINFPRLNGFMSGLMPDGIKVTTGDF